MSANPTKTRRNRIRTPIPSFDEREQSRAARVAVILGQRQPDWPIAGQTWYGHDGAQVRVKSVSVHVEAGEWVVTYDAVKPEGDGIPRTVTVRRWFGPSGPGLGTPPRFSPKPPKKTASVQN